MRCIGCGEDILGSWDEDGKEVELRSSKEAKMGSTFKVVRQQEEGAICVRCFHKRLCKAVKINADVNHVELPCKPTLWKVLSGRR